MTIAAPIVGAPIFVLGATATGKSSVATALAQSLGGNQGAAILAMDAIQVYRGADIGTSKPTAIDRAKIPHGGLDLADLGDDFDVAHYLVHAKTFLKNQADAGRRVIIVGGTGLYFRALTRGLCEAPRGPHHLRDELNALPVEALQERLQKIDPVLLKAIDVANPRRLVRAIEVMETTGRSLREWQAETPPPLVPKFKALWIQREKQDLQGRIEMRVEEMFARGWLDEVRQLWQHHGAEVLQKFPGIGYREIVDYLLDPAKNHASLASLKRDICVATRQYAKRQLTWFAREPNLQNVTLAAAQTFSADEFFLS